MKEKINILHVIESSETGGAEMLFVQLITSLDKTRFNNFAYLFKDGWLREQLVNANIIPYVGNTENSFDWRLIKELKNCLKKNNIHIIHSHLFGANVYSALVGRLTGIPVISTLHGMVDISSTEKFRRLKLWLMNTFSSRVVYVSDKLMSYFEDFGWFKKSKSMVIYNGIDVEFYKNDTNEDSRDSTRKKLGLNANDIVIGAIGDIRPSKGYGVLIEAASLLIKKNKEIKVVIAGAQTRLTEEYKKRAEQLNIKDSIYFLGFCKNVKDILSCIDVYVLPSITEGFSLSTIEAMAMELPVVVTKSGGPEEIVQNGETGLLVDVNAPNDLAQAVLKLINDQEYRQRIGYNARQKVCENFSFNKMLLHYSNIYMDIINFHHSWIEK